LKIIRWGIIGCGQVTEIKSGPGFQKANHSKLVAVMRRNKDLAEDYAKRHGIAKFYTCSQELIHDPEVDAVYIATPPHKHCDYVLEVARAGKPVYVEKPMALNYQQCQAMIHACEKAAVPLFVAYYRRVLPRFLKIKSLLDSGTIGKIQAVNIIFTRAFNHTPETPLPWRVKPEISGGGFFMDLACHTLDYLDFMLGPIESASGYTSNLGKQYPAEDSVSASFCFASGIQGTGLWSFNSFQRQDKTIITGDRGQLVFSSFGTEPVRLINETGSQEFVIDHPEHVQQPLIQTIVDHLNGITECPSTGITAIRTARVMEQILHG
jgi:predicted dehydrogenase